MLSGTSLAEQLWPALPRGDLFDYFPKLRRDTTRQPFWLLRSTIPQVPSSRLPSTAPARLILEPNSDPVSVYAYFVLSINAGRPESTRTSRNDDVVGKHRVRFRQSTAVRLDRFVCVAAAQWEFRNPVVRSETVSNIIVTKQQYGEDLGRRMRVPMRMSAALRCVQNTANHPNRSRRIAQFSGTTLYYPRNWNFELYHK